MTRTQRKRKADVVHRIGDWKFWIACTTALVMSTALIAVSLAYMLLAM